MKKTNPLKIVEIENYANNLRKEGSFQSEVDRQIDVYLRLERRKKKDGKNYPNKGR